MNTSTPLSRLARLVAFAVLANSVTTAALAATVTFNSVGTEEGRIIETTETSGVGSTPNNGGSADLWVGDAVADKQWRAITSFDTSSLPDAAIIQSATLRFKRSSVTGTSPFNWGGQCRVDVRNGGFNGNVALEAADFQATASVTNVAQLSPPDAGLWCVGTINAAGLAQINTIGKTQFRIYFQTDDNDNNADDYMKFVSGESGSDKPELIITYTDAYATVITGVSGLTAYWRLGDTSAATLADSSGNGYNGSYPIAPAAFQDSPLTWQTSDGKAVDFGGTGYGQVCHNAAFATARGTLGGYFKANSLAAAQTFVNKGSGFVLQTLANGTLQLTIGSTTISSVSGMIEAGVEYHIAVAWDQVAIWLLLDGRVMTWSRGHTAGLTGNSSNWQFGRTTGGANSNVRADEIAVFNRRISWEELWKVSEHIAGVPYNPTPETSQTVNSAAALDTALETGGSAPGHHILVAPGTYTNLNATMPAARSGLKRRPIVVRPQNGPGTATLANPNIVVQGRWVVFDGFNITGAPTAGVGGFVFEAGSRYVRATRCVATQMDTFFARMSGQFVRVDHNDVSDIIGTSNARALSVSPNGTNTQANYALMDHNYLHDTVNLGGNGIEAIGYGATTGDHNRPVYTVTYRNLFDNFQSDGELTSIKSLGNVLIKNTVENCNGRSLTYGGRHGPQTWHESEWWEEVGTGSQNSGVRMLSRDNVIIGCHVLSGRASVRTGTELEANYAGGYPAAIDNLIIGCTVDIPNGGEFVVGYAGSAAHDVEVEDTQIDASPDVTVNSSLALNTITSPTARIPFTAAVKLTTSDVGRLASDPMVPVGYK